MQRLFCMSYRISNLRCGLTDDLIEQSDMLDIVKDINAIYDVCANLNNDAIDKD
jgi:hypothetical protein